MMPRVTGKAKWPRRGQVIGSASNDSALAGCVGEYISSTVLLGSAVSLTTATAANVTTISLSAGDWNVWGVCAFTPAGGTTETVIAGWISTTSATGPTAPNNGAFFQSNQSLTGTARISQVGTMRLSLASATTVYLSVQSNFTGGTDATYGFIGARRVR